jgi:hypothetical protein
MRENQLQMRLTANMRQLTKAKYAPGKLPTFPHFDTSVMVTGKLNQLGCAGKVIQGCDKV